MMSNSKCSKGFTLLEVLLAVVVLSIALFGVIRLIQQMTQTTTFLNKKLSAQLAGDYVISEVELGLITPPVLGGEKTGDIEMLGEKWMWRLSLKNTEIPKVGEVIVSIEQKNSKSLLLNTYLPLEL